MPITRNTERYRVRFGLRFLFMVTLLTAVFLCGWISHDRFEHWQASQLASANANAAVLEALQKALLERTMSLAERRQAVTDASQLEGNGGESGQIRLQILLAEKERAEEVLTRIAARITQLKFASGQPTSSRPARGSSAE